MNKQQQRRLLECGMTFPALLWLSFGRKKRLVFLIHYLCAVVHAPPGERQHYSFIRSNEAKPCRSRKSQLNCSKEVYYCDVLWNHWHQDSLWCVFRQGCECVRFNAAQTHKSHRLNISICGVNRKLYALALLRVLQDTFYKLHLQSK